MWPHAPVCGFAVGIVVGLALREALAFANGDLRRRLRKGCRRPGVSQLVGADGGGGEEEEEEEEDDHGDNGRTTDVGGDQGSATRSGTDQTSGRRETRRRLRSGSQSTALEERIPNGEEVNKKRVNGVPAPETRGRRVRVWMDGAFDLMHFGHMNAFRQGRELGTELVVGVNSSASIAECKGPPVLTDRERVEAVRACRFVDEVVEDVPYVMTADFLQRMIEDHRIDMVVHGDDACLVDGQDVYASAKALGIFRTVPRTEGVSTTDLVGRLLLMTKQHDGVSTAVACRVFQRFAAHARDPQPGQRVVYVAGSWDLFHAGHASFLRRAKELGDYLLVGVYDDATVNRRQGLNFPLMGLHERALCVLGCRYVDDVLIGAPARLSRSHISEYGLGIVVSDPPCEPWIGEPTELDGEHLAVPQELGILTTIPCEFNLGVVEIANRILANQARYRERNERKMREERRRLDVKLGSTGF